jgi:hypothetical protein
MKATFQTKIKNISRKANDVEIEFDAVGTVDTNRLPAKDAQMTMKLNLKPIVADELKLGSTITIVVSNE